MEIHDVKLRNQTANILDVLNMQAFAITACDFKLATKWECQDFVFFTSNRYLGLETIPKEKSVERFI
jgi:hypothetical protein